MDEFRPEKLKAIGVSRSNTYAYPYLEHGNGLSGADRRFVSDQELRDTFETLSKFGGSEYLRRIGAASPEDFIRMKRDPAHLKAEHAGEVLELKVDPQLCFVGDMEYFNRIADLIHHGWSEHDAVEEEATGYWEHLVSLRDFLVWYRKPEWNEGGEEVRDAAMYREEPYHTTEYWVLKNAPESLPSRISVPEILIPESVPPEHIRVVA